MKNLLPRRCIALLLSMLLLPVAMAGETVSLEPGMDRLGADYKGFALDQAEPQQCRQACVNDTACKSFTYVEPGIKGPQAMCFLKSSVAPATANACCTSGAKTSTPTMTVYRSATPAPLKPATAPQIMTPEALAALKAAEDKKKNDAYEANQQAMQQGYEDAADASEQAHLAHQCQLGQQATDKAKAAWDAANAAYLAADSARDKALTEFWALHPKSKIADNCASGGCDDKWMLESFPDFQKVLDTVPATTASKQKLTEAQKHLDDERNAAKKICDQVKK